MSHLSRATRRDAYARRSREDRAFNRAAEQQMVAEADSYMMGDEEPEHEAVRKQQSSGRRPQGME